MARSLSDDPVKLENELLGLSRRAHAIRRKLDDIYRRETNEEEVTPVALVPKHCDEIRALLAGDTTLEEIGFVDVVGGDVQDEPLAVDF